MQRPPRSGDWHGLTANELSEGQRRVIVNLDTDERRITEGCCWASMIYGLGRITAENIDEWIFPGVAAGPDAAGQFGPGAYADWRATSLGSVTEALEQSLILRLAGAVAGRDVLDVGCGDGALTSAFWQKGAASVIGCDIDAQMITRARTRAAQQNAAIGYAIADVVHLPFRAESFDIVTMVTVLAFVPEPERALREITRILKPGGQLVIADLASH